MKRSFLVVAVLAAAGALAFTAVAQNPPPGGKPTAAPPPAVPESPPPSVPTLAGLMERRLKWGMTHAEVIEVYNSQQGLFERDYTAILARTQPGVAMDNVRAEMNGKKAAFAQ